MVTMAADKHQNEMLISQRRRNQLSKTLFQTSSYLYCSICQGANQVTVKSEVTSPGIAEQANASWVGDIFRKVNTS